MSEQISTFKDLIRLFWDNKGCDIIPVLDENRYVIGYYIKKNVTAHVADNTFLSQKISDAKSSVFSIATDETEAFAFEKLGELETFPVVLNDGTYKIISFVDFLSEHVPLKKSDKPLEFLPEKSDELFPPEAGTGEANKGDLSGLPKEASQASFEKYNNKVKLFLEDYEFNESFDLVSYLESVEKRIIAKFLDYYDYNISKTADALKIPRQTLQYKIKKYRLDA